MKLKHFRIVLFALACLLAAGVVHASNPRMLAWQDLQPTGEAEHNAQIAAQMQEKLYAAIRNRRADHYQDDVADLKRQIRSGVVPALNGQHVRLPGYMVPLDFTSRRQTLEFLLVPFFGACLHVPAPPPNQVVHVVARKPQTVGDLSTPIWIDGILTIEHSGSELASYRVDLVRVLPYEGKDVPYDGPVPHSDGY